MGIQTWAPWAVDCGTGIGLVFQGMKPSSTGEFVKLADHQEALAREVGRLREALEKALSRLPTNEMIEQLRADAGLGYRKYEAIFSDKEIVEFRDALERK